VGVDPLTGRMVSKFPGKCLECGGVWKVNDMIFYNEGKVGYFCSEPCAVSYAQWLAGRVESPVDAQTAPQVTYTTPQANIAVNEAVERSRAIHEAHMENMAANAELVRTIQHLTAALDRIAKWLTDDAMANRGLKL
jgi:hypothetical protein